MAHISQTELDRLQKKAKMGWAKFYAERQERARLAFLLVDTVRTFIHRDERGEMKMPPREDIPPHFTREFIKMAIELNKEHNCPVCYECVNEETIKIPFCAHIICKDCYQQLRVKKCPTCRKDI
jgi:hypothetical protein